jgi:predicted NUDIX family phosphoesterase
LLPEAACWPIADLNFMHPPLWRERAQVEHDETLLQPVAYGVLLNDAGEVWCYQRAGGDERVDGRYSCGVGGHVDAQDSTTATPATTA